MKKALSLLLVLVMLLSLCACGKDDTQNTDLNSSSQSTTGNTEEPIDGTTEATQTTTGKPTTAPNEEPTTIPAEKPTTKPTTSTACNHSYKDATCTAPKTCSKCGATSGNAAGHSYKDATCTAPKICSKCSATSGNAAGHSWKAATCAAAKTCSRCNATEGSVAAHNYVNGICSVCGAKEPVNIPLTSGKWCLDALSGTQLNRIKLTFSNGTGYMSVSFWGEEAVSGAPYNFNGKNYYDQGFGKGADLTYTENGNTVVVEVSAYGGLNLGTLTLSRTAVDQYAVTGVSGTIISSSITNAITVGSVFAVTEAN